MRQNLSNQVPSAANDHDVDGLVDEEEAKVNLGVGAFLSGKSVRASAKHVVGASSRCQFELVAEARASERADASSSYYDVSERATEAVVMENDASLVFVAGLFDA